MKKLSPIFLFLFLLAGTLSAQNKVEIELIDGENKKSTIEINWPFDGPPPIGSAFDAGLDSLDRELSKVCPPRRRKLSDHIWKCGNGKKIRTKDAKLDRALRIIAEKREED